MTGDEECQVFVIAKISDRSRRVNNILSVERELDMRLLPVAKEFCFYNLDDVKGEGCGENVYCGFVRQLWKNLVQVAIGWPESGNAVTIYTRKEQLVAFINVNMFYGTDEGVICIQETEKFRYRARSRVSEELFW